MLSGYCTARHHEVTKIIMKLWEKDGVIIGYESGIETGERATSCTARSFGRRPKRESAVTRMRHRDPRDETRCGTALIDPCHEPRFINEKPFVCKPLSAP